MTTTTLNYPVVRFSFAGIFAVFTTFILFFMMQHLIKNDSIEMFEPTGDKWVLDIVRIPEPDIKPPPIGIPNRSG
jgi:hypothetical protein